MRTMMSFHKAIPLDQKRARHAHSDERISVGAGLMIWVILAGFGWLGIVSMLSQ